MGGPGKAIVAGVRDRATGMVAAAVLPSVMQIHLQPFVIAHTQKTALVYTDELASYKHLPRRRKFVTHAAGQYVDGQVHTNGIESFWAVLKRGYKGTYHWMSPKHLQRYVNEFVGRHNSRGLGTEERMRLTFRGLIGERLEYSQLTA